MDHSGLKKIVIAGGSGFVGTVLAKHFSSEYNVVILSRTKGVRWDGRTTGDWVKELDGADALINLTGRNVNCRYTADNKKEILESRVLSTKILGEAMKSIDRQPPVWIQMSSATIYRDSHDKAMDETFGEIGDDFSMNVCKEWEKTFDEIELKGVRKIIMRTSIVIGREGGALGPMKNLLRLGFGGKQGNGKQMVSWIYVKDLANIVEWMFNGNATGVYNVTAPQPMANEVFMKHLRKAFGRWLALPTPEWLLKIGAKVIGTETELVLKSRWVIPKKLIQEGYRFRFPTIESALGDLRDK